MTFTQNLFCKVLGIDVKKNDGAKSKEGYVQKVPLNFADVHMDERYMPAQGLYTDKDGNEIVGVSRVFKEDLPTFGYYDLVAAVADMSRKVNALEGLLLKLDPEAAAEYAKAFPTGVPPTHQPMIPMQGDGNTDFRNVSDKEWKQFGANAERERQEIEDRDDERYRKLTRGQERPREEDESPQPKRKNTKKRNQQKKKNQKKRKQAEERPKIVPMAGKTTLISEYECESSEVEHEEEAQEPDEIVVEVQGKLNRELTRLMKQNLDGKHWAESNLIAARAAYDIMTGKRPRQYSEEEEEEEEHSFIEIEDDDQEHMMCRDLGDEIIVLSDSEEEDGVQPMDQEESPSLFKYDSNAESLHFTGALPNYFDLAAKPSDQELDLLLPANNNASLDLWGQNEEELLLV